VCLQQNSIQNWTQSVQYATRQFDWQLEWLFSLDNSTDGLTIRLAIQLTIPLYNFGWPKWVNDPSVRAATLPWSKAGVPCRGLRWRTLAESDARMGRVTRGKDSFWWHFSVDRFPIMYIYPGPTPATLTPIAETGPFIRSLNRFTALYSYTCALVYSCA